MTFLFSNFHFPVRIRVINFKFQNVKPMRNVKCQWGFPWLAP
jgi:hypothetical protein